MIKILKETLSNNLFTFNAMVFIPEDKTLCKEEWALFTHGYTASKSDCLNWAQRLCENNIPSVIFDLPGHHLGSYNSVHSFEDFKQNAQNCFVDAFNLLEKLLPGKCKKLILGGHSLGALLAIKALNLPQFKAYDPLAIAVGIGISNHKTVHLFESSFYEKTLQVRRQLVDETLDSDLVFPWIKDEKLNLQVSHKRIHLITGLDDVVVGEGGAEVLKFNLESLGNDVTLLEPRKLPHHEPGRAATHIFNFLKQELSL